MVKTNKCNSYVINGQEINVNDIIKHYNGNLGMACNEISQRTLASFETAKYYVELCQKDEPFVKQNSTASFTSGILIAVPLIMFIATKIGFFPVDNDLFIAMFGLIFVCCSIASIILGIIDLASKNEIPRNHGGSIFGIVASVLMWLDFIFH